MVNLWGGVKRRTFHETNQLVIWVNLNLGTAPYLLAKGGGGGKAGPLVFFMWRPKIYAPSPNQKRTKQYVKDILGQQYDGTKKRFDLTISGKQWKVM